MFLWQQLDPKLTAMLFRYFVGKGQGAAIPSKENMAAEPLPRSVSDQ